MQYTFTKKQIDTLCIKLESSLLRGDEYEKVDNNG